MTNQILLYIGSALTIIWGVAHLFPTKNVVKDFGDISTDNKHIITMEWIVEGMPLIFVGLLSTRLNFMDYSNSIAISVYMFSAIFLFVLASFRCSLGLKLIFYHSNFVWSFFLYRQYY